MGLSHNQKVPIHGLLHRDSCLVAHSPHYTNKLVCSVDYESRNESMHYDQGHGASNNDDKLSQTYSRERCQVIMAEDCSLAYNLGWKDLRNQEMSKQNRHCSIHFHKLIPREFQQGNVLEMAFEKTLRT